MMKGKKRKPRVPHFLEQVASSEEDILNRLARRDPLLMATLEEMKRKGPRRVHTLASG